MAIRVGRWDCEACGHKGNLGPKTKCSQCGSPRPKNVKFYLTTDAPEVKDKDKIKEAYSGVDWVCSSCGSHNKNKDEKCHSCGNPKEVEVGGDTEFKTKEHKFDEPEEGQEEFLKDFQRAPFKDWRQYGFHRLYNGKINPYPRPIQWMIRRIRGLTVAGMGMLALVMSFVLTTEIEVPVKEVKWERSIMYEEYREVQEEGWSVPAGGKQRSSFQAIHHYDEVLRGYETRTRTVQEQVGSEQYVCGTRDLGNGYFEDIYCDRPIYEDRTETYEEPIYDKVPVYQTKYKYDIFRWKEAEPLYEEGYNKMPHWPDKAIFRQTAQFREKGTEEKYYISIEDHKGEKHKHEVTYDFWKSIRVGQKVSAKKYRLWGGYIGLEEE